MVVVVLHGQNCVGNENCLYKAILKISIYDYEYTGVRNETSLSSSSFRHVIAAIFRYISTFFGHNDDTSLLGKLKILELNVQCLQSFSVSEHPCQFVFRKIFLEKTKILFSNGIKPFVIGLCKRLFISELIGQHILNILLTY